MAAKIAATCKMLDINNIFISSVLSVLKISRDMITKLNLDVANIFQQISLYS